MSAINFVIKIRQVVFETSCLRWLYTDRQRDKQTDRQMQLST